MQPRTRLGDQVIDERPDVAALPGHRHGLQSLGPQCRVHPRHQALGSRLLVPCDEAMRAELVATVAAEVATAMAAWGVATHNTIPRWLPSLPTTIQSIAQSLHTPRGTDPLPIHAPTPQSSTPLSNITCRPVQLPAEEQPLDALGLERRLALVGGEVIILDSVGGAEHTHVLQARQCPQ